MSTVRFLVLMATMGIVSNLAFAAFCCAIAAFGTYEALFSTSQVCTCMNVLAANSFV